MSKSLGQHAYEAYGNAQNWKELETGETIPRWEESYSRSTESLRDRRSFHQRADCFGSREAGR